MATKIPVHATYSGSDSDGLSEYQSGELIQVDSGFLLNKAHKIHVDAENSYGWGDIIGEIIAKGGSGSPSFAAITGLGNMYGYKFPGNTGSTEVFVNFHIPHDYADGTDIYFHTHWINATATPSTNNVVWQFEYTIAKGHGQQAFPAPSGPLTVTQACNATRYWHHVAETTAVSSANLEVDSIIMCRVFRDTAHASDTNADTDVYLLTADVHYQKNKFATKNRGYPFNT